MIVPAEAYFWPLVGILAPFASTGKWGDSSRNAVHMACVVIVRDNSILQENVASLPNTNFYL